MENLKITFDEKEDHVVCTMSGDISFDTVDALRKQFSEIRSLGPSTLYLNLGQLNVLGSAGLGEMARLILWCESNDCEVRLVCQSRHILEVIEIAGLTKYAPAYPDLESAYKAKK